jgi:diaminohydroxyphosphoribosylaminopyrimidine deaminase/5-amino-6-(5-phosphoribosylamino)uracil reductase
MSGIKRVVVGMKDPNPINNGAGMKRLIRYGIAVTCGVLEDEARAVNKPYIKFITEDIPYVTIKVAQTLDGKIATRKGDSRWITGEDSRRYVHALRAAVDAVMVGANTAMKDDPLLLSGIRAAKQPARVIVDGGLKIPAGLRIFSTVRRSPVIVAASERRPKAARLERKGAEVLAVRPKAGKVDLKDLLRLLAKRGIMHLLVEGGGELIAGLLEEGLADRALFFIAPKIVGGRNAVTSVEGRGVERIAGAIRVKDMRVRRFRDDVLLEGEISRCLPA